MSPKVGADAKAAVDEAREQIASGEISDIPTTVS
jgi:hypothetical protein